MSQTIVKKIIVPFGARKRETWFCLSNTNGETVALGNTLIADPKYVSFEPAVAFKSGAAGNYQAIANITPTVSLSGKTVTITNTPNVAHNYVVHVWGF